MCVDFSLVKDQELEVFKKLEFGGLRSSLGTSFSFANFFDGGFVNSGVVVPRKIFLDR